MFNFDLLKGGKILVAQCLIGYVLFFPLSGKRLMFTFLVVVSSVQKPNEQKVRADGFLFLFGCVLQRIQVVNLVLVHYVAKFLERTVELDWGCTQLFTLVSSQWLFCWVKFKLSVSAVKQWKEFLDYNYTIGFIFHEDAKTHNRAAKNRYTI